MSKEDDYPQIPLNQKNVKELVIKEENKKNKNEKLNILNKYISPTLIELNNKEQNSYFDMMLNDLANFKYQKKELYPLTSHNNKEISSNNLLYNYLEKYLFEISYFAEQDRREEEINKLYNWYKGKKKLEKDIKTINYKSYKEKNTIDDKEYFLTKKYKHKTIDIEKEHRNLELINKKMLEDYERKKLSKPFYALKKAIASQTFSSSVTSSTNFTRNKFEKSDLFSIYSFSKGTNNPTQKKYDDETVSYRDKIEGGLLEKDYIQHNLSESILLPPVDKETKFSYSYLRPAYDLGCIFLENQIIKDKNKQIAYKRSQEEIKKKIKEFSLFRAKLKENLNNKFEMKNLISLYVNKNDISSLILKKYKIKESEKQTIESKSINEYNNITSTEINNRKNGSLSLNNINSEKIINNTIKEDNSNFSSSNIKSESSEKKAETRSRRSKSYYKKINPFTKINIFEVSEGKNKDKNESSKNSIKNSRLSLSKKFSIKKGRKTLIKRNASLTFSKFYPLKLFSGAIEKIKTSEIQNLEKDSNAVKITDNTQIKDYKIKFPQEQSNNELLKKNKEEEKNDTIPYILANDTYKKERLLYEKLCRINAIKTNQDFMDTDINQRTKWDLLNKDKVDVANKILLAKVKRKNEFIKLNKKYNTFKNNLLSMRRSLSNDKKIEYQNLVDKIRLKQINDYDEENEYEITELESNKTNIIYNNKSQSKFGNKNYSLLTALINPKDNFNYSKFYLPRNGSMLLSRDKIKKFFD